MRITSFRLSKKYIAELAKENGFVKRDEEVQTLFNKGASRMSPRVIGSEQITITAANNGYIVETPNDMWVYDEIDDALEQIKSIFETGITSETVDSTTTQ